MDILQKLQEFLENTGLSMASRPNKLFMIHEINIIRIVYQFNQNCIYKY